MQHLLVDNISAFWQLQLENKIQPPDSVSFHKLLNSIWVQNMWAIIHILLRAWDITIKDLEPKLNSLNSVTLILSSTYDTLKYYKHFFLLFSHFILYMLIIHLNYTNLLDIFCLLSKILSHLDAHELIKTNSLQFCL